MSTNVITPGLVVAGRYRVVKQLGEGGVGAVYLVQHVHTDERLALKVLHSEVQMDPGTVERFRNEARAPARIDSDHIARVTDADVAPELGGAPFLVMEFLRGRDLSAEAEARRMLHPKEVVLYLRQAARALEKAHAIGIVHRDLKPENIFLTQREDGTPCVKLLDFGIAKLTGASASSMGAQSKTKTGAVFGTPLYMAPEQARAQAHLIGPHTDVWAIGLIAAKLLLGADYWQAETISDLVVQIVVDPIPAPSQKGSTYGPAFDAWFLKCCNRDQAQRYRSVGECITELASALGVIESPMLVLEVSEILQKSRTAGNTVVQGPPLLSQSANDARPVFASTPGPGQTALGPISPMGSTALATSTSMTSLGQPAQPAASGASGGKTGLFVALGLALAAAISIAAFVGLRGSKSETPANGGETAPLPLPTHQPKKNVVADAPSAEPTATPTNSAAAVDTAAPTTAPTSSNVRTKTAPSTTTKKKPSDDDLMSGRHH